MRERLGVRGRLFLAFLAIATFAVLAAVIAMYAFMAVGTSLETITRDKVPSTIASQRLSRQAERFAAAAPALLSVQTAEEHARKSQRLREQFAEIEALLAELQNLDVHPASLTLIKLLADRLALNLTTIDTMIFNNLVLVEQLEDLRRERDFAAIASRRVMAPGIRVLDAKVSELRRWLAQGEQDEDLGAEKIVRLAQPIVAAAPLKTLEAELSAMNDALTKAASVEGLAELKLLALPMRRSLETFSSRLEETEPRLRKLLGATLIQFRGFVEGPQGIVATRARQLRHLNDMQALLDQNVSISRQLTEAVDDLVARAQQDIDEANRGALSVQKTGTLVMLAVVASSLICSALIVWLYVGRNLIARLTGLSDSMLAIAKGELETPIPSGGTDEINRMAEALNIFRDTAIEVRESNLRELREMRRRLIDAIESISEGFSLYDADDRLVICNSRYREGLYSSIADVMVPGVSFETVVRTAAERGVVDVADDVEAWVKRRLALHRDPPAPHLQHQSDGRWIQISERKTEDGSTVAVYSDITELIEHEQALAEKSNALEQLSNQLAKYLSPQVYDSIFSGKQAVKVSSSRKKLTVFFSDIVGFTTTADRLESEELSYLLNHYLTDMSDIALSFGATIDKYMGDGVMIFFGDPETKGVKEDALSCVKMAIAMRKKMAELQDAWRESGIENPLQVRMGIHTGFCTVGNFGSENRMDYTIVGGAVNVASRMQGHAPPGEILISYETFALVKNDILCEERGQVEVKGLSYPIAIYLVVDSFENMKNERRHFREEHPTVTVEMKLDEMAQEDRTRAQEILNRALKILS